MKKIKNISKKTILIALGVVVGAGVSVLAVNWEGTDWIKEGEPILSVKMKNNFNNLDERIKTNTEDLKIKKTLLNNFFNRRWTKKVSVKERTYYKNTKRYPIEVSVKTGPGGYYNFCRLLVKVEKEIILDMINNNEGLGKRCSASFSVSPGERYYINPDGWKNGRIISVYELK